jgi:hypothetical protein
MMKFLNATSTVIRRGNTAATLQTAVRCTAAAAASPPCCRTLSSAQVWAKHENPDIDSTPSPASSNCGPHKFTSAHVDTPVPKDDYYKGHLMADQLEYLDDVLEKTVEMEETMEDLKETYNKKKQLYNNIGWMESSEIQQLFNDAAEQKAELSEQIAGLKKTIQQAREAAYAVEAPNGESDEMRREDMRAVDSIIRDAAVGEDRDAILQMHAQDEAGRKVLGVDAPDGLPDDLALDEQQQVNDILNEASGHVGGTKADVPKDNRKPVDFI